MVGYSLARAVRGRYPMGDCVAGLAITILLIHKQEHNTMKE